MQAQNLGGKPLYESKQVKIFLVNLRDDVLQISGEVHSNTRQNLWHHVTLFVKAGWIRGYCDCEANALGLMCQHITTLYNVYRKEAKRLGGCSSDEQD